eukprot:3458391-Pleurochrysis_carterae.AAC.1
MRGEASGRSSVPGSWGSQTASPQSCGDELDALGQVRPKKGRCVPSHSKGQVASSKSMQNVRADLSTMRESTLSQSNARCRSLLLETSAKAVDAADTSTITRSTMTIFCAPM